MNTINALSVPFYEFRCDNDLVDEVLLMVKTKTKFVYADTSSGDLQLSTDFYHKKLINWFEECVDNVSRLLFDQTYKIEITNCWATRTNFASKHHIHRHHQSIIAGIFYLQNSDFGETVFITDNPWHECSNFIKMPDNLVSMKQITQKIKQEKGKLILYPGHLKHGTMVNKEKRDRYTIVFDSFFSGRSNRNAMWPYFEIKTTNIHEAFLKSKDQSDK